MKFKESEKLELKKSTSELKEAVISIASILNKHSKGMLYFGIKDNGTILGQNIGKDTVRDIAKAISDHIEPTIYPKITIKKIENKNCVQVTFQDKNSPYFAYGRAYMRVGDSNKQLSIQELEKLILKKNKDRYIWDSQLSNQKISSINEKVLKTFIAKAKEVGRLDFLYQNKKISLKKLGLVKKEKLLNAATVLFCDDNSLEVQMAIFAGNDKLTFLDIRQLKGNIFNLLKETELYLKNNIRWRVQFGKLEREEIPEIPIDAIREALVNSFCHKDYNLPESNKISIFKNRIEIYNPGDFPEGLTPEDFIKGKEESVLRNPKIAQILYLSKEIEKFGSGLKRISDQCKENNIRVEFHIRKTGFVVTFYRHVITEKEITNKDSGSQKTTQKTTQKILDKKLVEKLGEGLVEKLGENELKILKSIMGNRNITTDELAKKLDISNIAVYKNVRKLKEKEIIKRIGPDKGGHWEIVNKK
ncbi:MAG: putative DNA binding domain-containing protein [Elusimicrobia bacterium]|nr:putative DNA binding domain-containing protein [Elusimicrobiota bacterium]